MKNETPFWDEKIVTPEKVLARIEPGMSIFLGTGMAEPRTLVKSLMASGEGNLQDLELIQLVSLGETIPIDERYSRKYRLKTFFSGWIASSAITAGQVDLVPSRFARIPELFKSGALRVDVAFVQITEPHPTGYASLGIGTDVARSAMESASIVVGEINADVPWTLGDTLVHVNDFDFLVRAEDPLFYIPRWPFEDVHTRIAENIASVIDDDSCLAFSIGPVFEALAVALKGKKGLGVHTPFFTDSLMDLVDSGAVSNRNKDVYRGKSLASYALGTKKLMKWLAGNPLVEFQPLDVVANPQIIGMNRNFIAVVPARKADLTGLIALHAGKGNITAGPGAVQELFDGAQFSRGGRTIFTLPSRNLRGEPNILLSVADLPNQFSNRESLDMVATEYGIAHLAGRTVRERAQALIDIAHPDDRLALVESARQARLIYVDQIYVPQAGHFYPDDLTSVHNFKGLEVYFRAIKPSDEDQMRRLFYRFSDKAVYYRYFSPIKAMPHTKMQEYVNVDYRRTMSIVGLVRESGMETIIAEARYVVSKERPVADVAFIVDEEYQGRGIGNYMLNVLIRAAMKRGLEGFTADVLADNKSMMKVFEKGPCPAQTRIEDGNYSLYIPFRKKSD